MAEPGAPTIEKRLRRRFLIMSSDAALVEAIRARLPAGWEMLAICDLDEAGGWQDLLLYRFLLLDLDEKGEFDPADVIRRIRVEYMLQLPVFCFGGNAALRDEMRLARADRFFDRDQIPAVLPQFFAQYAWGG